jgi:prevent-host-death family protein
MWPQLCPSWEDEVRSIGIRELKAQVSQIVREVGERREPIAITHRGRVVARLIPTEPAQAPEDDLARFWAEWDELAAEIADHWPQGVSATEAVGQQRRQL